MSECEVKSMLPFWTVGEVTQVTGRKESSLNASLWLWLDRFPTSCISSWNKADLPYM